MTLNVKGVGEAKTKRVFQLPIGFKLKQSGLLIPAAMQGYEIEGADHPLLLSLDVQAKLGLVRTCVMVYVCWKIMTCRNWNLFDITSQVY